MRCRLGDIAVIIKTDMPENFGGLVEVLDLVHTTRWRVKALSHLKGGTNYPSNNISPGDIGEAWDSSLRPLRDDPGQDETLVWKDIPCPVRVT